MLIMIMNISVTDFWGLRLFFGLCLSKSEASNDIAYHTKEIEEVEC